MGLELPKYLVCHTCEVALGEWPVAGYLNLMCERCGARHCPLCGRPTWECPHLLATACDGEWLAPGMRGLDLPPFAAGEMPHWPAEQRLQVFGRLFPLLQHFEAWFDSGDWAAAGDIRIFPAMLDHLGVEVLSLQWSGPWVREGPGVDYFCEHPVDVRRELDALCRRLDVAFRRLASSAPWRMIV